MTQYFQEIFLDMKTLAICDHLQLVELIFIQLFSNEAF